MCPREAVSDHGLLFGENSLYEVLAAIAGRTGEPFHGAALAREVARTEAQVQTEISKLARLGVLEPEPLAGRARHWHARQTPLAASIFSLPALLEGELGSYRRAR